MDSPLSLEIKCSLCLDDYTEPVTLSCEHSFCRQCITDHMKTSQAQSFCPECRRPYSATDLRPSRLLRNVTDAVREHLSIQRGQGSIIVCSEGSAPLVNTGQLMCAEHEEKLKLFCETDQKLVCVVCRDGQKHRGHQFKPVKEASRTVKEVLKGTIRFLAEENRELDDMAQKQTNEATKTTSRSKSLSAQISAQFEEMHQFLKKKEEELKKQLEAEEKSAVNKMCKNSSVISEQLMEGKEKECVLQSALEIAQPDSFLRWWHEKGFPFTEKMKQKDSVGPQVKYRSTVQNLRVIPDSLFLGPYETHLPFFVWKEMLRAVKPVPELLSIQDPADSYLKVAPGGAHVWQAERKSNYFKDYNPGVVSTETFQSGQHYVEVEVGKKLDWSVGVREKMENQKSSTKLKGIHLHLRHGQGYMLSYDGVDFPANVKGNPSKIGLYLDCEREQISFYNADTMSQILLTGYSSDLPYSISLFPGLYLDGSNNDPITVCSYRSN